MRRFGPGSGGALIAFLLILAFSAGTGRAEVVRLASGEHDAFTRIVVDLSEATPWQLGRTPDGYVLRFAREGIRYDVTQVFQNIPRTRLAAIWADPASGDLRFGIGCACHAMPFEFRDNVIVVDIKDGPPPPGSSFEQSLDGRAMPKLAARDARRPKARPGTALPPGFDWTRMQADPAPDVAASSAAELGGMRNTLLQQLSRGAAQGLVNLSLPANQIANMTPETPPESGNRQVATGFGPGFLVLTPQDPPPDLTPTGAVCLGDAQLDIASWADARPYPAQLAEARAAMLGEFDRPDPDAVERLARLQLHFGFGLEARMTLRSMQVSAPDAVIWETMARIVDNESVPPIHPFAGQQDCDTAAALWSVLAQSELRPSDRINLQAVLRNFSGLPLWLRRSLGPGLAERFIAIGDGATARAIRDSILRAPGDPGPAARLVDAQLILANGQAEQAVARIEAVAQEAGPMLPDAMIDLVEARVAQGIEMDFPTIEAIEALAAEHKNGPLGPRLRRAEGLARALGGDFTRAFALSAEGRPDFDADLWPMLANRGSDAALLSVAVRDPAQAPRVAPETAAVIARRLIDLGFPDAALSWLPPANGMADLPLLAARAELMRRDARAALRVLAGLTGAEADRLRAAAQTQLGDTRAAAAAFESAGDSEAAGRAIWQAQDWAAVASVGADPVRAAAAALALPGSQVPLVVPPGTGTDDDPISLPLQPAPLARGRALVEDSMAARSTVLSMLDTVPGPEPSRP